MVRPFFAAAAGASAARATRAIASGRSKAVHINLPAMGATTEEAVELLSGVPVFATLGPDDLAQIAQVAVPRRFAGGHVVFREGDESDTCYVIRDGHARALREHPDGR